MIDGNNIIGCKTTVVKGNVFGGVDPSTGEHLEGDFAVADTESVNKALQLATDAFKVYRNVSGKNKAFFLRAIAQEIKDLGTVLIERAMAESGLPVARITGEVGRTTGQLNMFADLLEEGSWVDAVIDHADPERLPIPKSDIRRMLKPIGPVVVFGASNFPLAFSVGGGDTASALASGCPVVVKAHPAHPGTSALVGHAISKAAIKTGMPEGVFSLLFDNGYTVGAQLVQHEQTKAVAFTGSYKGGMALIELARNRQSYIPVFTEMGSINPVVILPGVLQQRAEILAKQYAASITLGAGQFCTNPGLILAVRSNELDSFIASLANLFDSATPATMLTGGIFNNYQNLSTAMLNQAGVQKVGQSQISNDGKINQAVPTVARVSAVEFMTNHILSEEVFGPWSLIVEAENDAQLLEVAQSLNGQLTATVMAEKDELEKYNDILETLTYMSGRVILNGVPTGVEVCAAMQHGGPFPATSDGRFTSVGTGAIYRFVRPIAWQDWEDSLLPPELQAANPLNIWRQVNNNWTNE